MTMSNSPLMPDEIIECMGTGRDPTVQELYAVAERIWTDGSAGRSALSWGRLALNSGDRLKAIRGAQLALYGDERSTSMDRHGLCTCHSRFHSA